MHTVASQQLPDLVSPLASVDAYHDSFAARNTLGGGATREHPPEKNDTAVCFNHFPQDSCAPVKTVLEQ